MPEVTFGNPVLEKLVQLAKKSPSAAVDVGKLLAKAEAFDTVGPRACNIDAEVRCIGQYEVLPVCSGRIYAFVELKQLRTCGEIFLVYEVDMFGDLRRAWELVHDHFGYDNGPGVPPLQHWP